MTETSKDSLGRLLCLLCVVSTGIPLFVLPGYFTTNLTFIFSPGAPASLDPQPLRIHWAVVFAAVAAVVIAMRVFQGDRRWNALQARLVLLLTVVFGVALTAGLIVSPTSLSVVYFLQTVIPLTGFWVGFYLVESESHFQRLAHALVAATSFSIVCILALAVRHGIFVENIEPATALARDIPQVREYFPLVSATCLSFALAAFDLARGVTARVLLGLAILIQIAFCSIGWSRMGIVLVAIVLLTPLVMQLAYRERPGYRSLLVRFALLALAVTLFLQSGVYEGRRQRGGFERSNRERFDYALVAARVIAGNPLVGRMFIPDWESDPIVSRDFRIPRPVRSHNQYLDYAVRAGLPVLGLLGLILWRGGRNLRDLFGDQRSGRRTRWVAVAIAGPLLAVCVGNLAHLFLVQAQTGILAWFLLGVTARLTDLKADQKGPESLTTSSI